MLDSNLFTHRNTYAILREATSEAYGPRVYYPSYKFPIYFIFQSLLSIYIIKIPKIFILLLLSLSGLTLASGREGIEPLYRVGCEVLICLCRYEVTRAWSLKESWIRGCPDSRTIPSAGLLDNEDTRLKTSSRVRMGLSLAWKATLAMRIFKISYHCN